MTTVNATITLKKQTVPSLPQASSSVRFQLVKDGVVVQTLSATLPNLSVSFLNVADGTYTIVAQRLNQGVAPQGTIGDAAMSDPFTVVNMAEIDVPDLMTVSM